MLQIQCVCENFEWVPTFTNSVTPVASMAADPISNMQTPVEDQWD